MRRNSLLLVSWVAGIAVGCAPPPERVTVDLDRVPPTISRSWPAQPLPTAPDPFEPQSVSLEPLPGQVVLLQEGRKRLEAAQKLVEQSRREAYDHMLRVLRGTYRSEIKRWAEERLEQLGPTRTAEYDSAFGQLRALFEQYADARGPKMARLALIVGFPDWTASTEGRNARWSEEAKRLQAEVRALDAEFAQGAARLLAHASQSIEQEAARVQREVQAAFAEADARAERTASEQMASARRELDSLLAGRTELQLNAEPGERLELSGSSPVKSMPQLPDSKEPEPELRQELELWLRSQGYVLAPPGTRGRDVTKEFVAWRAAHQVGP